MIHVEDFNLCDSISALELMDPKMDTGVLSKDRTIQSVSIRIKQGRISLTFTSARNVLKTLDELLRWESMWLNGNPLQQTLLTCEYFYMDTIQALLQKTNVWDSVCLGEGITEAVHASSESILLCVMAAIPLLMIKTCHILRSITIRADIFEEEEFSSGSFSSILPNIINDEAVFQLADAIESRIGSMLQCKKTRKVPKKKKNGKKTKVCKQSDAKCAEKEAGKAQDIVDEDNVQLYEAMLRRLQLRKAIFRVLSNLDLVPERFPLSLIVRDLQEIKDIFQAIITERLIMDSAHLSGHAFGFDPLLSHIRSTNLPPRNIILPSLEKCIKFWMDITEHLAFGARGEQCSTIQELRKFLVSFSRHQPNIIVRSYVLLFLCADKKVFGRHNFSEWIMEDMVLHGVPSVLLSTQEGMEYTSYASETVYESIKMYLHAQSHQRSRIEYLLQDWGILQTHAASIDDKFITEMSIPKTSYPRYLTAWTLENAVAICNHYILLGLELELYSPSEYGVTFWYLDYFLGSRLQNLSVTSCFIQNMNQMKASASRSAENGKDARQSEAKEETNSFSKKSKRAKKPAEMDSNDLKSSDEMIENRVKAYYAREIKSTEMLRAIARACSQTCILLERQNLISTAPSRYGSTSIRFQHRFAPLQTLQYPSPICYEEYLENDAFYDGSTQFVHDSIDYCFKLAHERGEQLLKLQQPSFQLLSDLERDQVQKLIQVCIGNTTALHGSTSAKGSKNGPIAEGREASCRAKGCKSIFDFGIHPHFPLLRIRDLL
nr:conserved hypothetical protein [Albugo laibachii Nc14]|eukprot:CCA27103.1 conserved hypothetical protein [Albugo laibachii Nc14]